MNSLLQKHGCANVFRIPEGLKELMSDITREVLRDQPANILEYITNYLSALLLTREHGFLAVKILEQLCDCKPTLEERLLDVGIPEEKAQECAMMIQEHFESCKPIEGDKVKERIIMKKLLCIVEMDLNQATSVCKIMQEVFRDYWQKKMALEETISKNVNEPWEIAAQRTIEIYKSTKPTFEELIEAAKKIQDAEEEIAPEAEEGKEVEEHSVEEKEGNEEQRLEKEQPMTEALLPALSADKKLSGTASPTAEPSKLSKTVSGFKEEVHEYQDEFDTEGEAELDASRSEGDGTSDLSAMDVTSSATSDFADTEVDDIPDDTTDGQTEEEG